MEISNILMIHIIIADINLLSPDNQLLIQSGSQLLLEYLRADILLLKLLKEIFS